MLRHLLLVQGDDLPTQQASQLGTDHFLLFRHCPLRHRFSNASPGIHARGGAFRTRRLGISGLSLSDARSGEVVLPINGFNGPLKAAEESFGAGESGLEVDRVREFVDWLMVSKDFPNQFLL